MILFYSWHYNRHFSIIFFFIPVLNGKVIVSDLSFVKWNVLFTTVLIKTLLIGMSYSQRYLLKHLLIEMSTSQRYLLKHLLSRMSNSQRYLLNHLSDQD